MRLDKRTGWIITLLLAGGLLLYHLFRIFNNPNYFWAPAIDQKVFGSIALNFLDGLGPRFDAMEPYQFSRMTEGLECYYFSFLHPYLISLWMTVLGDRSFYPVLISTAVTMALLTPILYFVFLRLLTPPLALFATLLLSLSPSLVSLGPSGQSEPLMLVELSLAVLFFTQSNYKMVCSLLGGIVIGAMNITRPTGMILAPAFFYLYFNERKRWGAIAFAVGFTVVTLWGSFLTSGSKLEYSRVAYPAIESDQFGGISALDYSADPKSPIDTNLKYIKPILLKTLSHSLTYLSELPTFWSDFWVFLPAVILLLWKKNRSWVIAMGIIFLLSVLSVVSYFPPTPRVNLHLFPISLFLAVWYLRSLKEVDRKSVVWAMAFGIPFSVLLSESRIGMIPKLLFEVSLAIFFMIEVIYKDTLTSITRVKGVTTLALFIALAGKYMNSNFQSFRHWQTPTTLYPFQESMTRLEEKGIGRNSLILSDDIRDVAWFSRMRGIYLPRNLSEMMEFLNHLKLDKYLVLVNPPSSENEKKFFRSGFLPMKTGLSHLWIYRHVGNGSSGKQ